MAHRTRKRSFLSPSSISVHDNGYMTRKTVQRNLVNGLHFIFFPRFEPHHSTPSLDIRSFKYGLRTSKRPLFEVLAFMIRSFNRTTNHEYRTSSKGPRAALAKTFHTLRQPPHDRQILSLVQPGSFPTLPFYHEGVRFGKSKVYPCCQVQVLPRSNLDRVTLASYFRNFAFLSFHDIFNISDNFISDLLNLFLSSLDFVFLVLVIFLYF